MFCVQEALESYSSCLEWIPDNNLSIKRDVLEGMCRCCTKLGQRDRALELAESLVRVVEVNMYFVVFFFKQTSFFNKRFKLFFT